MTGPALWHYTCGHRAGQINASGFLLPNPQPVLGGRSLIWATDLEAAFDEPLGLTSVMLECERTAYRYAVLEPSAFVWWPTYAREQRLTWEQRAALEGAPGALPRHWWVATRPVGTRPVFEARSR